MHKKQTKEFKLLRKKVSILNNKFDVLLHYWKIRCNERQTLAKRYYSVTRLMERVEKLERTLCLMSGRHELIHRIRATNCSGIRYYPLYLTRAQRLKLAKLLRKDWRKNANGRLRF